MPCKLLEQLESYLPEDPVVLVGGLQICDGVAEMSKPPVWLHMDIMADNIQMVPFSGDNSVPHLLDISKVTCGNTITHTCSQSEETSHETDARRNFSLNCLV
jgi:hypothetical protein